MKYRSGIHLVKVKRMFHFLIKPSGIGLAYRDPNRSVNLISAFGCVGERGWRINRLSVKHRVDFLIE